MTEAHQQLAPVDGINPALLKLGRDLAKACLTRATKLEKPQPPSSASDLKVSQPKIGPPPPRPSLPNRRPKDCRSMIAGIREQAQLRQDWCSALTRELDDRRFVARELVIEALRLVAPDERRQFLDLVMQWLEHFEVKPAAPSA
jgi:hypothetical protein